MAGKKTLDKRQIDFLEYWCDPNSPTFADAKNSAIRAGYSVSYAEGITQTSTKWVSESASRRMRMLNKAERNLDEALDLDPIVDAMGPFGPIIDKKTGKPYKKLSMGILAIKIDTSKFVVPRLDKSNWSEKPQFSFIDPSTLTLSDAEKAEIDGIFQENIKHQQLHD